MERSTVVELLSSDVIRYGFVPMWFALLVGTIFLFRWILIRSGEKLRAAHAANLNNVLTKKAFQVNVTKYGYMFTAVAMIFTFTMVIFAFEYPQFEESELIDFGTVEFVEEEVLEIPPTEQKPPPPPKIQQPEIVEVSNEEEIEEEIEIELDVEIDEETVVEEVIVDEEPEEVEVVDEIFEIVEESAAPPGGFPAFYKRVAQEIEYPKQARRMNIQGKVFVQFVIEKDGSLTDFKIARGIGEACDQEAIRVLKKEPKWKPGKQRGRAVRQRMVIPIHFQLR